MIKQDQEHSMKRILSSSTNDNSRSEHSSNTPDDEVTEARRGPDRTWFLSRESAHTFSSERKKMENDVNPLLERPRLKFDLIYFWNWWSKFVQKTTWQKLCCRIVILRQKNSIGYHLKFEERRSPNTKSIGTCFIFPRVDHFSSTIAEATSVIEVTRSFDRTTAELRNSSEDLRMFVEASLHTRPLVIDFLHVTRSRYITKALT